MKRRALLGGALAAAALALTSGALAQQGPIKIGMSMAQTGGLAGGGKASLLGIEIWRDEVNAKGGLLGRKVELVVYDDKSSASETPAIYAKLLDVDKVDLLFAPYATVPTAPLLPLVKQRGLLLMGNFSFQINSKIKHDMWFNNAPWGPADSWAASFLELGKKAGGKTIALLAADQEFAQNLAQTTREVAKKRNMEVVYDQSYPPNTVEFSSIIRALNAKKPDIVYVASYPPDSAGILRAVNEIGVGDNVKLFGGAMVGLQFAAVMENMGSLLNGVVNYNTWLPEPSMYFDGTKAFFETYAKRRQRRAQLDRQHEFPEDLARTRSDERCADQHAALAVGDQLDRATTKVVDVTARGLGRIGGGDDDVDASRARGGFRQPDRRDFWIGECHSRDSQVIRPRIRAPESAGDHLTVIVKRGG